MSEEIISGINPVKEALRGSRRIFELFIADGASDQRIAKLSDLAGEKDIPVRRRSKADINRLAGTDHHQGVALRIEAFAYAELEDVLGSWQEKGTEAIIVVLD